MTRQMRVVVNYQEGPSEDLRLAGPLQWDVRDGHLTVWDDAGDVIAERDEVVSAVYDRSLP
ncbi:hypothetical protein [Motilibacter deserti]|uniref:YD repeat-containing protein n=1 Tax=Motilibacter deserti TaxID=2714956 RepID=A0ABX0GVY9_9ACTN|nr:hypothetical protein [Motilibacter deserti]NHC15132.1 hypothetical protein [Motilibacter deserti]